MPDSIKKQAETAKPDSTEDIEFDLFLQALFKFHGYDFRQYDRNSLKRSVKRLIDEWSLPHICSLIPLMAHNPDCHNDIINGLTINYSMLFRDPIVYAKLQQQVFPYLASYPRINIWIAGCAEGEEAYSLAILLEEANLLERTQIYATDISVKSLAHAASGILRNDINAETIQRYQQSTGQRSLADYFVTAYGKHKLKKQILSKIHFEQHNLIQQPSFISAELILCRNVFIYFNKNVLRSALENILTSLTRKGFLVIGTQEHIDDLDKEGRVNLLDKEANIYQK